MDYDNNNNKNSTCGPEEKNTGSKVLAKPVPPTMLYGNYIVCCMLWFSFIIDIRD